MLGSSSVGGFPTLRELNRRTIRGPVNPLDVCTLVSIYPRRIKFRNITLVPGRWTLEAGSREKPAVLTIGTSSCFRDVGPDEPLIEIIQSSPQVAASLCNDYMNGLFACDMHSAMPGLFYVPGRFTAEEVQINYKHLLDDALVKQHQYYRNLIKYADALWARSNGNPLTINDEMRMAAKTLGAHDHDWMKDHANVGMVRCFACGAFKHPDYAICQSCHTPDPEHPQTEKILKARAMGFATAQAPSVFPGLIPNEGK